MFETQLDWTLYKEQLSDQPVLVGLWEDYEAKIWIGSIDDFQAGPKRVSWRVWHNNVPIWPPVGSNAPQFCDSLPMALLHTRYAVEFGPEWVEWFDNVLPIGEVPS